MSPPVPGSNGAENQAERRLDDILPGLPCLSSRPLAAQHGPGGQGHAGHLSYMPRLECVCLFAHTKQAFYTSGYSTCSWRPGSHGTPDPLTLVGVCLCLCVCILSKTYKSLAYISWSWRPRSNRTPILHAQLGKLVCSYIIHTFFFISTL